MAAPKEKSRLPFTALLTALVAAPLLAAPPIIRGLAAHAWVRHFADLPTLPRPRKATARLVGEKAAIAVQYLAPLPQSSSAAILALEIGQRVEQQDRDRESAVLIYRAVRAACERVRDRPLSGAGFAVIAARAAALEDAARTAASP